MSTAPEEDRGEHTHVYLEMKAPPDDALTPSSGLDPNTMEQAMMKKPTNKVASPARERLRATLDESKAARTTLYQGVYQQLDQAQLCVEPVRRLREARRALDQLIASYKAVH